MSLNYSHTFSLSGFYLTYVSIFEVYCHVNYFLFHNDVYCKVSLNKTVDFRVLELQLTALVF